MVLALLLILPMIDGNQGGVDGYGMGDEAPSNWAAFSAHGELDVVEPCFMQQD